MNKIYVISVSTDYYQNKTGFPLFGDFRTIGWYDNEEDAIKAVKENWADIHETCYDYAFIEEVEQGLYGTTSSEHRKVYRWTNDFGFVKIKDYEWTKHFCGYSFG